MRRKMKARVMTRVPEAYFFHQIQEGKSLGKKMSFTCPGTDGPSSEGAGQTQLRAGACS